MLDGITVVAVEQAVAAPFATRQLADLGARVIKVERPDGGDFARGYDHYVHGLATHFVWLNRGKESVALDFSAQAGRAALETLIAHADVFVQNLAPGAAARAGFDAASLHERYPRIVAVDLAGYGPGPYQGKRAYDLLVQAESALVSVTGTPVDKVKTGIPLGDIAGGSYVYSAVLAALYRRERTGAGAAVTVSLFDALIEWMSHPIYVAMYGGSNPKRRALGHTVIAPYDAFPTLDGEVVIGIQNDREWARFATGVLGRPDLVDDAEFARNVSRVANREAVDDLVASVTAELSSAELEAALDAAGIASARINEVLDLPAHPQIDGRWLTVDTEAGPVRALPPPARVSEFTPSMGPVPRLGEHTEAVLAEFGVDRC